MDLNPSSEVMVYCECGAAYRFSGSHMGDSIECTMCGRRVRMKGSNSLRAGTPERTALQSIAERHGDEEKVSTAVYFAKEHRYKEALGLYQSVLNGHPLMRDVFYGMGYCHYRMGDLTRGLYLVQLAHECGHANALDLVRKIHNTIDASRGGAQV